MPIKPENAARYPKHWKQIRARILERAGNACEGSPAYPDCRVPNGAFRVKAFASIPECWVRNEEEAHSLAACAADVTLIVLTIGHLRSRNELANDRNSQNRADG